MRAAGPGSGILKVFSVIDIGSNTVHLLVAASDGITIRPIYDTSEHLRLGADLELLGEISPLKVAATAATLRRYVEKARDLGAERVRLLATQAVRSSRNRRAVVSALQEATGETVSVLEPDREAYLAVLGAALTHGWDESHLVVDVGGASTQIIVASAETLLACRSVPVGSGRLASRFTTDPPGHDEVVFLRHRIEAAIRPAMADVLETEDLLMPQAAVIVGGAMRRVARLVVPSQPLPVRVATTALRQALAAIEHQPAGSIAASSDLEYDKVGMVRAGALILAEVLRSARLAECTISPYGIREGAILDAARSAPWQHGFLFPGKATADGEPRRRERPA